MKVIEKGGSHFRIATLNITIQITNKVLLDTINAIHKAANQLCFIAQSLNFPIQLTCTIIE